MDHSRNRHKHARQQRAAAAHDGDVAHPGQYIPHANESRYSYESRVTRHDRCDHRLEAEEMHGVEKREVEFRVGAAICRIGHVIMGWTLDCRLEMG